MSFEDQVHKVLSKPEELPQAFLDYLIQYAAANPVSMGALRAPMMISTGTKGATKATRWVGSTTSGSPVTGYGVVGDFVTTQDGNIYICTVKGSPGTWVRVGNATSSNPGLMAVRVNIVGNQSITAGDPGTIVTWGETVFDTGSPTPFWSAGAPTLLTAPINGYYLSLPNPIWDIFPPGITANSELAFYLYPGSQTPDGFHALTKEADNPQGSSHYSFLGQHHAPVYLNAGDSVKINAYFNNGGGGGAPGSLNLLDLRTIGYTALCASWSLILIAAA